MHSGNDTVGFHYIWADGDDKTEQYYRACSFGDLSGHRRQSATAANSSFLEMCSPIPREWDMLADVCMRGTRLCIWHIAFYTLVLGHYVSGRATLLILCHREHSVIPGLLVWFISEYGELELLNFPSIYTAAVLIQCNIPDMSNFGSLAEVQKARERSSPVEIDLAG